jgi:hypothetical protein
MSTIPPTGALRTNLDGDATGSGVEAVAGRRRDSWRRLDIPASLLNEVVGLSPRRLLEKVLFADGSRRRLSMMRKLARPSAYFIGTAKYVEGR